VPAGGQFSPGIIAAASPSDLVISDSGIGGGGLYTFRLLLSTDGGTHWSNVVSDREDREPGAPYATAYLGFQDPVTGRWVGYSDAIWTTTDGGRHWTQRRFP
jgi:photosystem II stability/assembly factor-like uncharacterized protein